MLRNIIRSRFIHGLMCTAGITGVACGSGDPSLNISSTGLALTMDIVGDTDVAGMRFQVTRVSCEGEEFTPQTFIEETELDDILIPSGINTLENNPLDAESQHTFADKFMSLDAGCYDVITTPLDSSGEPSEDCAPAVKERVEVHTGQTTEIFLINQCTGEVSGSIDIISALNHPPNVQVEFEESKFGRSCEMQSICATAKDPDNDPVEFAWTQVSGGAYSGPIVQSSTRNPDGSVTECVEITPLEAGRYEFSVTAYDQAHRDGELIRIEDWLALEGYANDSHATHTFPLYADDSACGRTYTLDADFDEGFLVNLKRDPAHQLQLNVNDTETYPFVCVAVSGRGSLVRVDANDGTVLGEYATAPSGMGTNPSRTTVDKWGNCWVANRAESGLVDDVQKGSVSRVGIVIGGERGDKDVDGNFAPNPSGHYLRPDPVFKYNTCVDRDGDGLLKTSAGLLDTLAWSNDGSADSLGGISTAEDECIINYTRVTGTGTRTISISPTNDVWVGGLFNRAHERLDGVTGQPQPGTQFTGECGGYGGLVDGFGTLWSASGGAPLLRFVPDEGNISGGLTPVGDAQCLNDRGGYGMGVDPLTGHVWHSSLGFPQNLYEIDSDGTVLNTFPQPFGAQGVAVDHRGHVWVAEIFGDEIWHLAPDPASTPANPLPHIPLGLVSGFGGSTGLAADHVGKIWVPEISANRISRIDPALNGGLGDIDLQVDLGPGASPYNYSDMTGLIALGVTQPSGMWSLVHEGCAPGTNWSSLNWNGETPEGTQLVVEARASDNPADLSGRPFIPMTSGVDHCGTGDLVGQYLEIRVTLSRDFDQPLASPVLYDLGVQCCE